MSAACLTFDSMLSHIFPTVLNSDVVKILFLALSRKKKEKTRYCSHARPAQFFFSKFVTVRLYTVMLEVSC